MASHVLLRIFYNFLKFDISVLSFLHNWYIIYTIHKATNYIFQNGIDRAYFSLNRPIGIEVVPKAALSDNAAVESPISSLLGHIDLVWS